MPIDTTYNHGTPTNTNTTTVNTSDKDPVYICPHCDRIFISHIGLVGHLRIHHTETGKPVPEAPTYTRRIRLHCPHCPCTFMQRMGLSGHIRIHESGIDRSPDAPSTSIMPRTAHTPSLSTPTTTSSTITITEADTDTADFSCPHCPRTFTSRIGLIGHLRIHLTETGEPVLEHQPTHAASTSTVDIALAHLFTARVY
ncbi:hypothetical protein SprV_0100378600 [Sparganum proliferum]